MAHEIEGNNAFYTVRPAWHGLGTVLKDAPTIDEALRLAYPHNLFKLDVEAVMPMADGAPIRIPVEKACSIFRDDGKEIGYVGKDYGLVQPYDAAHSLFDRFEQSGEVELEAGGSLNDGARMWLLAKIKNGEREIVKGDPVKAYLLMATSFDGSMSHLTQFTNTRVVCANTLASAVNERKASRVYTRHSKNINDRLSDVAASIDLAKQSFDRSVEAYQYIASKKVNTAQLKAYVRCVFEAQDKDPNAITSQLQAKIDRVTGLLDSQTGLDMIPAARGTMWQGYNAVTQYLTHEAGRTDDTRLNSTWFGANAALSRKALELALAN